MKNLLKYLSLLTILVLLILSGCAQNAPATQDTAAEPSPTAVAEVEQSPTEEPVASTAQEDNTTQEQDASEPSEEPVQPPSQLASMGETCMVSDYEKLLPIPPVSEEDWIQGSMDALTTILVYSDLECPYCAMMDTYLNQLSEKYPDDIRLVWRHFPLSYHEHAMPASQAIEAAGKQDKDAFVELKSRIFTQREQWVEKTVDEFNTWLEAQAGEMGLDVEQFSKDMQDEAIIEKIQKNYASGQTIVTGTPFVLINGIPYQAFGRDPENAFLNAKKLKGLQFSACPEMTIDENIDYQAKFVTDQGDFTIDLYEKQAPITVNSFIFLAKQGWYDQVPFHRVIPEFVAQAGDPLGLGFGGPGYMFVNEISPELKYDKEGVVGMANSGVDTNGSQFFITYTSLEQLDGNYTIFGQVVDGMEAVKQFTPRDPSSQEEPPDASMILSVEIIEA